MLRRTKEFLQKGVWKIRLKDRPASKIFFIKQLRIFLLAFRGFAEDKVQLRASALTFYTLLSIVPVLAMIFGIAKGFGFEEHLKTVLQENLSEHQEILNETIVFAERMLKNIKGGFIAGTGLVMLIWSVMKVLGNIENAFNNIWQIKKSRGISRKLSDYLSLVVIAPILVFISSGIAVSHENSIVQGTILGYLGPVLKIIVWILSFTLIWFVFSLLYIIMPNTKVNFRAAFPGGVVAGSMFQLLQWAYVHFQSLLSGYGTIYGSFAALPLFLMWMQFSWLIVLFGAEIAFAYQNVENYEFETDTLNISNHFKMVLSLLIARQIIKNFTDGIPAMTASEISHKLDIPVRIVRDIIYELYESKILSETVTKNVKEVAYQPAQDPGRLSLSYVIKSIDNRGVDSLPIDNTEDLNKINNIVNSFSSDLEKSSKNILLKDL
jgi:membrane protein